MNQYIYIFENKMFITSSEWNFKMTVQEGKFLDDNGQIIVMLKDNETLLIQTAACTHRKFERISGGTKTIISRDELLLNMDNIMKNMNDIKSQEEKIQYIKNFFDN